MKTCSTCKIAKPLTEFYTDSSRADGYNSRCKPCQRKASRVCWRKKYDENPEPFKKKSRDIWHKIHSENPEKLRTYSLRSYHNRKTKPESHKRIRDSGRRSDNKRYSTIEGRLNRTMRCGIWKSLKGAKRNHSWQDSVGYTREQLIEHLEKQFKPNMSWKNYGKNGWTIDHIKPQSKFTFTSTDDSAFKECWALSNLQPLWHQGPGGNCSKGNRTH